MNWQNSQKSQEALFFLMMFVQNNHKLLEIPTLIKKKTICNAHVSPTVTFRFNINTVDILYLSKHNQLISFCTQLLFVCYSLFPLPIAGDTNVGPSKFKRGAKEANFKRGGELNQKKSFYPNFKCLH